MSIYTTALITVCCFLSAFTCTTVFLVLDARRNARRLEAMRKEADARRDRDTGERMCGNVTVEDYAFFGNNKRKGD